MSRRQQLEGVSRREDISNTIWDDPDFADLTAQAKLVYLWSFTNPRCNMAGLYKVPVRHIGGETGLTESRVEKALSELQARRFVYFDGSVLWVRARVKHIRTRSELMARSVVNTLEQFGDHPFVEGFNAEYASPHWLDKARNGKPHG